MNKQIKLLAEHAGAVMDEGNYLLLCEEEIEKFAELIIRKCARIYWSIDNGEQYDAYVKELKKHFKVK